MTNNETNMENEVYKFFQVEENKEISQETKKVSNDIKFKYSNILKLSIYLEYNNRDSSKFFDKLMFLLNEIEKKLSSPTAKSIGLKHYLRNGVNIVALIKNSLEQGEQSENIEEVIDSNFKEYEALNELYYFLTFHQVDKDLILEVLNNNFESLSMKKQNINFILKVVKTNAI